jgi:serine/threonine-protein kinase HipA
MTSEAYAWIWLPGEHEPVVCGKLEAINNVCHFVYGRSYLERSNAIALDPRELPLQEKVFSPPFGETHSVIRDAAPDAWGRRVLAYQSGGQALTELDFLLQAGRDRVGALDFRPEASAYPGTPVAPHASIADLVNAAEKLETGQPLPESLGAALLHGSSIDGARPKSLLEGAHNKWIAKFSSSTDHYPVVRSEYAAMWLAGKCGLDVPDIQLLKIMGKDVLLVKRFDRKRADNQWHRRFLISGLTALQLHETESALASYPELASFIRRFGDRYPADVKQLFRRMIFNILIGNTDDHARNHSFFWDGVHYTLTPAYDICPMLRAGQTAYQAMIIGRDGRESTIRNAVSRPEQFNLTLAEATIMKEEIAEIIKGRWDEAADLAGLTDHESKMLKQATILSPACFY